MRFTSKSSASAKWAIVRDRGHRARIVGFTHGIRSFTTSPYVFTTFKNAQNFATFPTIRRFLFW